MMPHKHRALRMLPFTEQGKRFLITPWYGAPPTRGLQQQPWRAVPFDAPSTLPAPLDFSRLEEKAFLIIGIRRLRFCHAEPVSCLPEFSQLSPIAVVPLVALPPPCPCIVNSFGDPRKRFSLGCQPLGKRMLRAVLLRPRMPNTRFAQFLRELGCSRSTPAAPQEAASLSQEVTLWPRVLSQCRRRMPNTFCPRQLRLRSPTRCAFCHTLRRTIVAHCASERVDPPESVSHVSTLHLSRPILEAARPRPAIVLLLSLGG